jgi:hypothetical protein
MTSRKRSILEIAAVSLMVALAGFHFISGAYRTAWWGLTFVHLALPVLVSLLQWSLRRDSRMLHTRGHLALPSSRLSTAVTLAVVSLFVWMALVTYVLRTGLPDSVSVLWLSVPLFLAWLAWFVWTIRRARGYAFTLEPLEKESA